MAASDAWEDTLPSSDATSLDLDSLDARSADARADSLIDSYLAAAALTGGETITLDLSNIFAGESATLIFRLVNNDSETGSSVRILGVGTPGDDDPPQVTVDLENDTAPEGLGVEPYRTDRLTNDSTVVGTATDDLEVVLLEAQIDDGGFTDITGALAGGCAGEPPGR